jgi:hypothetical protein
MTFARTRRWPSSNRTAMVSSLRRCRVRVVRVLIVTLQDHVAQSPNGGRRLPFLGMRRVGGVCNGCYSLGLPPPPAFGPLLQTFSLKVLRRCELSLDLGLGAVWTGLRRSGLAVIRAAEWGRECDEDVRSNIGLRKDWRSCAKRARRTLSPASILFGVSSETCGKRGTELSRSG